MNLYNANWKIIDEYKNKICNRNKEKHNRIMELFHKCKIEDIYITSTDGRFYQYTCEYEDDELCQESFENIYDTLLSCYANRISYDNENDYYIGIDFRNKHNDDAYNGAYGLLNIPNFYGIKKDGKEVYFEENLFSLWSYLCEKDRDNGIIRPLLSEKEKRIIETIKNTTALS